jgi:hypothetical protein
MDHALWSPQKCGEKWLNSAMRPNCFESRLKWKVAHEGVDVNFGLKDPQTLSALNAYKKTVSLKNNKFQHYDRDETAKAFWIA